MVDSTEFALQLCGFIASPSLGVTRTSLSPRFERVSSLGGGNGIIGNMGQSEGLVQRESSAALRAKSLDRLQLGFARLVEAESKDPGWDPRDAMVDMTPFIDCARQLGFDPVLALSPIAATGAGWFRETFETFVARSDVTLAAFGWSIVDTPQGRAYRHEWRTSIRRP